MSSQDELRDYRRKRDAKKTSEPAVKPSRGRSRARAGSREPIFVVQRHDARRLHYDFRLERNGALASWAVPNGVPLEPGERHLAVHVEDHPLEYATFAGEIPKGQYGAGTVEIWDQGTYELLEEKKNGGLTVRLAGKRLQGTWTLVPAKLSGDPKNWLILRKADGAISSPPGAYRPMAATPTDHLPAGEGWWFEPKWDGYRALAYVRGGVVDLRSRRENELTTRFSELASTIPKALRTPDAVIDGEICRLDETGRATFSAIQQGAGTLVYVVFDVLEADGEPLVDLPLTERRKRLAKLVDPRSRTMLLTETFDDGEALLDAAAAAGLEGVMAKRVDAPYEQRRSRAWLKLKIRPQQEFVVCGYTKGQGRRQSSLGALVLGIWERGRLRWAGNVGTGFTDGTLDELLRRLRALERPDSPFGDAPKMPRVRASDVVWVEPVLVAEVEFVEWTHQGRLRFPTFLGLRDDKAANEVRREEPFPTEITRGRRTLKLSNLDKVFWPREGITKGDLLAYYREVAPVLVPHLRKRPFTMKRYPDGAEGKMFFQKDAPSHMPDWIETRPFEVTTRDSPRTRRKIDAPIVDDELGLLWMVNMGCIDMNTWYSRVDKPDRPDWVLFDLDPSPDVGFDEVVEVALLVRQVLDALELESCVKTSGADGMHVLVPIARRSTYGAAREFAEIVARTLATTHRGLVTTEWSKAKRRGVLVDANQNGAGKTIASAYSVRPVPGASVSTPLRWDEVKEGLDPQAFTMDAVLGRVARHGDLFAGVLEGGQSLAAALKQVS